MDSMAAESLYIVGLVCSRGNVTYPFIHAMLAGFDQLGKILICRLGNRSILCIIVDLRLVNVDVIPRKTEAESHDQAAPLYVGGGWLEKSRNRTLTRDLVGSP